MTETQAKSGVAGAAARTQDAPEETPDRLDGTASHNGGSHAAVEDDDDGRAVDDGRVTGDGRVIDGDLVATDLDGAAAGAAESVGAAESGGAAGLDSASGSGTSDGSGDDAEERVPGAGSSGPIIGRVSVGPSISGPLTGRASVAPSARLTPPAGDSDPGEPSGRGARTAAAAMGAASRAGRAVAAGAVVGAAKVTDAARTARANMAAATGRGPRRARLNLKRIDPWSVMKFAFAVSLVLFVVSIVATSVLYLALDAMHVFDSINNVFSEVAGPNSSGQSPLRITAKGVIGTAVLLGAVNMVLFTALATLGAFVYNVCADLVGGVEVTLSEKE